MVFHLAAFFANQRSVDYVEASATTDVIGHVRLLQYSALADIEKFVYASSGCSIYGSYPELPVKEDFLSLNLTTPYQINKMAGEMYCNFFYHQYGLGTVNCRFFNSYGVGEVAGQYRNVIPNFIYWAMKGQPLPITGEGKMTRDFTYVEDIVDALLRAGVREEAIGQEMNIASAAETEIVEMANTVNDLIGNKAGLLYTDRRKWDTKSRLLASVDRARGLLGYEPKTDFTTGLLNTIRWFEENWESIQKNAEFPPGMSSAVKNYVLKQEH